MALPGTIGSASACWNVSASATAVGASAETMPSRPASWARCRPSSARKARSQVSSPSRVRLDSSCSMIVCRSDCEISTESSTGSSSSTWSAAASISRLMQDQLGAEEAGARAAGEVVALASPTTP